VAKYQTSIVESWDLGGLDEGIQHAIKQLPERWEILSISHACDSTGMPHKYSAIITAKGTANE
jgi:hypothetical protein